MARTARGKRSPAPSGRKPDAGVLPRSTLGLPLLDNHDTVFDRSQDAYGVVRFAPIRPPA